MEIKKGLAKCQPLKVIIGGMGKWRQWQQGWKKEK